MTRPDPDLWQPIHGMRAAYPLACFTGALVTDIAYARSANIQWANFSVWLIAVGVMFAVLAAIAGIVDALATRGRERERGRLRRGTTRLHRVLTIVTLVFAVLNGFIHSRDGWTSVVPTGLTLSAITAALIVIVSWTGYAAMGRGHEGDR